MLYTRRHGENYPSMRYPPPYRIGYGSTVDIEEIKTHCKYTQRQSHRSIYPLFSIFAAIERLRRWRWYAIARLLRNEK